MSLLILYFGLVATIATAEKPGNDSVRTLDDVNNSSILEKANSTSNEENNCQLPIVQNDIKKIIEQSDRNWANIIDLYFFNSINNDKLFGHMEIALVNRIGREILYTLDDQRYSHNYGAWALEAGRKSFDFHVEKRVKGCSKNSEFVVAESILKQIVSRKENSQNFEICILTDENRNFKSLDLVSFFHHSITTGRICCRVSDANLTNFQYDCKAITSVLHQTVYLRILLFLLMLSLSIYGCLIVRVLCRHTMLDILIPDYHTLQESTTSLRSIFLQIIWRQKTLTLIRKAIFLLAFSYHLYFCSYIFKALNAFLLVYMLFGAFTPQTSLEYMEKQLNNCDGQDARNRAVYSTANLPHISSVLTVVFGYIWSLGYPVPICLVLFLLTLPLSVILMFLSPPVYLVANVSLLVALEYDIDNESNQHLKVGLFVVDMLALATFGATQFHTFLMFSFSLLSLLLGLLLNLSYFLPHVASFSVFAFYGYSYWVSMEEKYFLLKFLIYKACLDEPKDGKPAPNRSTNSNEDDGDVHVSTNRGLLTENGNPGRNRNLKAGDANVGKDEELLSVVSKKLYEAIRRRLLPYHENVSWTCLKLVSLGMTSYGIYQLLQVFQQLNITTSVQVAVTAIISIVPKVFDTIALTRGMEGKKEAWKEELQLKVKHILKEEISKADKYQKKKLLKTKWTIPVETDPAAENTSAENRQYESENRQYETSL